MTNIIRPQPLTQAQARRHRDLISMIIEKHRRRCQLCGADENCIGPRGRTVDLTVAFDVPPREGGRMVEENLTTICSWCASGLRALASHPLTNQRGTYPPNLKAKMITLLRHASMEDQRAVLGWLIQEIGLPDAHP